MTLAEIAKACNGRYIGKDEDLQKEIEGAVTDSRLVEKDYLFIPIKGARADGHSFIPEVFQKGALAVLSERELDAPAGACILVDSTEEAMKKIAAFYRRSLKVKVVGITGSVGKTSTKEMIASVLSQKYHVLKTEKNYNNEIGLPLTIFKIKKEHEVAVLEMGISDFGEMHRLAEMAYPDICVITNIGLCHLENLKTRDGILKAKTESFEHMPEDGVAVLNGDDDKLSDRKIVNGKPAVFYGMEREAKKAVTPEGEKLLAVKDVYATDVKVTGIGSTHAVIHAGEESFPVEIPIAGEHHVYNALAAVSVGMQLGLTALEMKRGIEAVQTLGGHGSLIEKDKIAVMNDCYNANPVSMMASIDVLSKASGRKIAVLGDMGELGAEEKKLHAMVGEHFAGKKIDALFCTGALVGELAAAAESSSPETELFYCANKQELTEKLLNYKKSGDTILVKASHFMEFGEIVKALTKQD